MSLATPIFLLGLVPVLAAAVIVARGGLRGVAGLPGSWARIVEAPLRRFLAAGSEARRGRQVWLCIAIAALVVLAMARPTIDRADHQGFGNLAGRVLVIDLGGQPDIRRQRLVADRLIEAAPDVPTALVVVAADAYSVVPLTTDRRQIERYLQVLEPEVMPVAGRALHVGIAHAEGLLRRAGSAVRQIILIPAGAPPAVTVSIAGSQTLRAIAPVDGPPERWSGFASTHDADIVAAESLTETVAALRREISRTLRARTPTATAELTPYVIALALLLWLGLFRRRAGA